MPETTTNLSPPARERDSADHDQRERGDRHRGGGPERTPGKGRRRLQLPSPHRQVLEVWVLEAHDEVASEADEEERGAERQRDCEAQSRGARGATDEPTCGDEPGRDHRCRRDVDTGQALQHEERDEPKGVPQARGRRGDEEDDQREVRQDDVVRRNGTPLPEHPARGEERPGRDCAAEVRARPAPHDEVKRPGSERNAAEQRHIERQRRAAREKERGRVVRQRPDAGLAVEESVPRRVVDVRLRKVERRRRERVRLPGEYPGDQQRVEAASDLRARQMRAEMRGERPGEPDDRHTVERERHDRGCETLAHPATIFRAARMVGRDCHRVPAFLQALGRHVAARRSRRGVVRPARCWRASPRQPSRRGSGISSTCHSPPG